jgi:uncharacterized protein
VATAAAARARAASSAPDGGLLGPQHARAIAEALVRRHAGGRAPDLSPSSSSLRDELEGRAAAIGALPPAAAAWLEDRLARARRFLRERADLLLGRAGDGRIRSEAVALSLADVRFESGLGGRVDAELRPDPAARPAPDDVALEVAALAVALVQAKRADLAERLVSHYAGRTEDFDLYRVLDLHETRAVAGMLARCAPGEAAGLATRIASAWDSPPTPRTPPFVVAMSGQVASGKSTLARALADELGAPRVVADRIRDHLVHGAPGRSIHEAGWASGFEPGFGPRVYAELMRHAEAVLETGRPVVLDACFPTAFERDAARALALRHGIPFCFVECVVPREVQERRLRERDAGTGDDWSSIATALAERFAPAAALPDGERWRVDTRGEIEGVLASLVSSLVEAVRTPGGSVRDLR